jgi:hypothetical protein
MVRSLRAGRAPCGPGRGPRFSRYSLPPGSQEAAKNAGAFELWARMAVVAMPQSRQEPRPTGGSLYRMMRKPGRALRRFVPASGCASRPGSGDVYDAGRRRPRSAGSPPTAGAGAGRTPSPWRSVASVRSMRRRQAQWRWSSRSEKPPPRPQRAAPRRQRVRNQRRLGSKRRRELVALSLQLAHRSILSQLTRLGGISGATASHRGARVSAEQALRLGAQELRPAGADPPRRRAEARGAQHGRDRCGRDADPELQKLTLDAHVATARVLARQSADQAADLGGKRRTTEPARPSSPISP